MVIKAFQAANRQTPHILSAGSTSGGQAFVSLREFTKLQFASISIAVFYFQFSKDGNPILQMAVFNGARVKSSYNIA